MSETYCEKHGINLVQSGGVCALCERGIEVLPSNPVAYLKEWTTDGGPRARVDLHAELEAWMVGAKVTPLYPRHDETKAECQPLPAQAAWCPKCQQSMPGGDALHTDHCPAVKTT